MRQVRNAGQRVNLRRWLESIRNIIYNNLEEITCQYTLIAEREFACIRVTTLILGRRVLACFHLSFR